MNIKDGWEIKDIEEAIQRDDLEEMIRIPIFVSLNSPPDCEWAQDVCLRLTKHTNNNVRANAVLCFGHLSRTCGKLDESIVKPIIEAGLKDNDPEVKGRAWSAADDVTHFLKWKVEGFDEE
jgi:hypothetical protein